MASHFSSKDFIADTNFSIASAETEIEKVDRKAYKQRMKENRNALASLQRKLYADDSKALLLVFQAMDAAGKDSTIRAVMSGVNPQGCSVHSFKQPTDTELSHDFLWRTTCALPEQGRIGIFNRSYYEEVLVVKVHPEYLSGQKLPDLAPGESPTQTFWDNRYESISDHEKHLARNGTRVLKFFLNVSRKEQHCRFLSRIDEPEKNWKFSAADLEESEHWDKYMSAYESAIRATTADYAPWFVVPADHKRTMRLIVSDIIREELAKLDIAYPKVNKKERERLLAARDRLIVT